MMLLRLFALHLKIIRFGRERQAVSDPAIAPSRGAFVASRPRNVPRIGAALKANLRGANLFAARLEEKPGAPEYGVPDQQKTGQSQSLNRVIKSHPSLETSGS